MSFAEPGHFYSPIPDPDEALRAVEIAERGFEELAGIDIDRAAMMREFMTMLPFMGHASLAESKRPDRRYHVANDFFCRGDALVYYAQIAKRPPKTIIEIGSGYSSALALDVRDELGLRFHFVSIEPDPKRLHALLRPEDLSRMELIENKVQCLPLTLFAKLGPDDILFIDSSHVAKTGSDVLFEIFGILPQLTSGVRIHFHDVFWPFEYPRQWVLTEQRAWNEIYFLRAFLTHNDAYRILFFNNYYAQKVSPLANGGSLWLQRR